METEAKTLFYCNCACPLNKQEQCFKNCAENLMKLILSIFSQCLFLPAVTHTECKLVLIHAGTIFKKLEKLACKRQTNRAVQIVSLKKTACDLAVELKLKKTSYHNNWYMQMPIFCDSHTLLLEVSIKVETVVISSYICVLQKMMEVGAPRAERGLQQPAGVVPQEDVAVTVEHAGPATGREQGRDTERGHRPDLVQQPAGALPHAAVTVGTQGTGREQGRDTGPEHRPWPDGVDEQGYTADGEYNSPSRQYFMNKPGKKIEDSREEAPTASTAPPPPPPPADAGGFAPTASTSPPPPPADAGGFARINSQFTRLIGEKNGELSVPPAAFPGQMQTPPDSETDDENRTKPDSTDARLKVGLSIDTNVNQLTAHQMKHLFLAMDNKEKALFLKFCQEHFVPTTTNAYFLPK